MAPTVGTVTKASGMIQVKKADGTIEQLQIGSMIEENDVVMTRGAESSVVLELDGGRELVFGGNEEVLIDQSVFAAVDEGTSIDVAALQAALEAGVDPSDLGETAAGEEAPSDPAQSDVPYEERGDARGSVEATLRPTAFEGSEVVFEEPEGEEVPAAAAAGNTPPVADDETGSIQVGKFGLPEGEQTYTLYAGGEEDWEDAEGVSWVALLNGNEDPSVEAFIKSPNRLGVIDTGNQGQSGAEIDNDYNEAEGIKFTFDGLLNSVTVGLRNFNTSQSHGEGTNDDALSWEVWLGGSYVAGDEFTGGPHDALVINTEDQLFDTLIINASSGEDTTYHTNFYIDSIYGSGPSAAVIDNEILEFSEEYLLTGDTDAEGDTLNIVGFDTTGTQGEVTMDEDGNITYDPAGQFDYLEPGQTATDSFTYTVSDGELTDTGTVTVTIVGSGEPVNAVYDADTGVIDGGEGYDTIIVNPDASLDFSDLQNIEHIDLQGGSHELTVSAEEVFNATDSDNLLQISGENGDTITLDGFSEDAAASASLDGYTAYVGSYGGEEVTLHIDTDIDVDLIP